MMMKVLKPLERTSPHCFSPSSVLSLTYVKAHSSRNPLVVLQLTVAYILPYGKLIERIYFHEL